MLREDYVENVADCRSFLTAVCNLFYIFVVII